MLSVLHKFRMAFAAAIGSAVALASAAGIFLHLNEGSTIVRLSDRIDPARAIVYVSTPDRKLLFSTIDRYRSMTRNAPSESNTAAADRYEYALLRTGSGAAAWIMNGYTDNIDTSLLLPTKSRASLTRTPFFASLPESAESFVWFDLASFPLPESAGADIVRAAFSAYTEGILLLESAEHGKLMLRRPSLSSDVPVDDDMLADDANLLRISLGNPKSALSTLRAGLTEKNRPLLEGLVGILGAQMEKRTGSSDLSAIGSDLLSGPTVLSVQRIDNGALAVTLSGTARHSSVFSAWLQKAAARMTEGRIRRREFLKEYTRTDVVTDDTAVWTDRTREHGWMIQRLGATGSDLSFTVATLGSRYIIGNAEDLVRNSVGEQMPSRSGKIGSGTADVAWATAQAESLLPFLAPLRPVTEAILGSYSATLTWSIAPMSRGIMIDWTLGRQTEANLHGR